MSTVQDILQFWFTELTPRDWYIKNLELDESIRSRFGSLHSQAAQGELFSWRKTSEGRVAEIIILDQFSRNLFRESPKAFASDSMALVMAQEAVSIGALEFVDDSYKHHILLPYMHSESVLIHEEAVKLRKKYQLDLEFELKHKVIIDRFGRYPHRNEVMGRVSTDEELQFLKEPNSSF